MKQIILSLIAICSVYAATAQSCVTVQQVSTNYANKQITFDLKWGTCNNTNHLYRVWVFVDYRPVTITTKGAWGRATIAATDKGTLVSANNGVWVTGSANATQRVTLTLNVIGDKFDWCAFAIDYPPNATMNNGVYTLKGTPPFILNNNTTWSANTYTGNITAITDATNNPEGFVNILGCTIDYVLLGTVGFASTQTWIVGSQTWSAPVTATYCNKTDYSGGSSGAYKSDCRTNPGYNGHLFSWCMVARFKETLCLGDWRVPTRNEFIALDKALGGSGSNRTGDATTLAKYMNASTWGGQYGGYSNNNGSLTNQGSQANYWSQSEGSSTYGYNLYMSYSHSLVYPQVNDTKYYGFPLRCVK